MNKKKILEMTGLSESDFYKQYPTQEHFIKKFKSGGFVDGLRNVGAILADNTLSVVGASNVADNNNWYSDSKFGKTTKDVSKVTNKISAIAGQVAATAIGGPGAGMALGALQQGVGSVDKLNQSYEPNQMDDIANGVGQLGSAATSLINTQPTMVAEDGGIIPGGTIPEGKTLINVERNELEVDPNSLKIIKHFKNKPNHPAYGIDEQGNTLATVGNVIIPKNMSKRYEKSDTFQKKAMINNLKYKQTMREGGKYEYGGMIKKYAEGSTITPSYKQNWIMNNLGGPTNNYVEANKSPYPVSNTPLSSWINPKPSNSLYGTNNSNPSVDSSGNPVSVNPMLRQGYTPQGQQNIDPAEYDKMLKQQNLSKYSSTASKVGMYAPAIYNLGRGLFDKPYSMDNNKYMTSDIQAPQMTGDAGRRDMLTAYNTGKYNINQLRTSGTLSGLINNNNKYSQNLATYNENLENKNKLLTFEASRSNQDNQRGNNQLKMGIDQFNEQNKAAKRNFVSTALTQGSDIIQNERNNDIMYNQVMPNLYKYYTTDKEGNLVPKYKKD